MSTQIETKLEAVVVPVSAVDRSKRFYESLGWRLDADFAFDNGFRIVRLTPPGSPCSIQFGTHVTSAAPGSAQGLYLIVSDIEAARTDLASRGAKVSKTRLPGRGMSLDTSTLTELLQEAEAGLGKYEPTAPKHHWSAWYAAYVIARERGRTSDEAASDAAAHVDRTRAGARA